MFNLNLLNFLNSIKTLFKPALIWGLILQLSVGVIVPSLYAGDNDPPPSEKILGETYKEAPWPLSILSDELPQIAQSPQVQAELKKFDQGLQAIEEGRTSDLPQKERDVFRLGGQRFEIFHKGKVVQTFDLGKLNIELPYIAYDRLTISIEGRDLVINAINAGDIVARHIIPEVDALATAMDRELLYIFDTEGRIHAADMALARTQALFRAPIPFFQNLWTPLKPLNLEGEVKLTFLTRGLKPFEEMDPSHPAHREVVLPREHVGDTEEIIYSAGDLVVYKESGENGSERHLLGVFSRSVTHMKIARAELVLSWLGMIANPSEVPQKTLQEAIEQMDAEEGVGETLEAIQGTMTPVARKALSAFGTEAIQAFVDRAKKNGGWENENKKKVAGLKDRVVDQMALESWAQSFETLRARAVAISENGLEKEAQLLKAQLDAQDLGPSWQELSNPNVVSEKEEAAQGGLLRRLSQFMPKPKTLKILGSIAAGGALTAGGYYAEIVPIVHTVNYLWANWVPSVLHDAEYRWPLTLSVISLMAFIPLCQLVGIASVPVMDRLSKLFAKLPGARARKLSLWLEARANVWRPMTTWQRNVSMGMRYYARIILPVFHWMSDRVLRQPNFLAALRAKINPLSQNPGHPEAGRIGLNSPIAGRQTLHEKRQALSDLVLTQNRINAMARNLALLTVGEETDIDPATLLLVLSGNVDPTDVQHILEDPVKKKEWDLTTQAISESLANLDPSKAQAILERADPAALVETYRQAQAIAAQVRSQSHVTQALLQLKQLFVNSSQAALSWLANLGVEDYELLARGYAAPAIAKQVQMEFVTDHAVVVGYPSFWGPRADLSDRKNLAADPNGVLYSTPGHLYDLVVNVCLHFLHSGARQMLVYFKKPEVVETRYEPEAKSSLSIAEREEGLLRGGWHWMKGLLDFRKSDLGGIFQKNFIRQVTTIQAGLVLMFITRIFIAHQNPEEALRGWWLTIMGSTIYIGWVWYVLQAGNYTDVPRIGNKVEALQDHLVSIRKGIELKDPSLVEQGRQGVLNFYREAKGGPIGRMTELEALTPEALVEHAVVDPPFATQQNGSIQWIATWFTAFLTTYLGVVLTVNSLDNDHLSNANLLRWTWYWIAFSQGMWLLTSAKSWNFLHKKFDQAKAWIKGLIDPCEKLLDPPASGS